MIVYCKLIKIPLGKARGGIKRHRIIMANPEQIKIVTKGETIEVAIIPIGAKLPKSPRESGAVKIWAPVDEARELAKYLGRNFIYNC